MTKSLCQTTGLFSNLSFLSKLTERIIKDRLHHHLVTNTMYNCFQSAYAKFHSTETTLLAFHDHFISSTYRQQVTGLTLLDLSAAFNTINHSISYSNVSHLGLAYATMRWIGSGHICLTGPFLYPALPRSPLHYLSPVVFLKAQS